MDSTPQDNLPPLDLEYAQQVVKEAPNLERVQQLLPLIPKELQTLLAAQDNSFLFGVVTMGQALHDLLGKDILLEVAEILKSHEDNQVAVSIASEAVRLIAMMEAIGYLSCKEIVDRGQK